MPTPPPNLPKLLKALRELSPKLNALTDAANKTVREIEHFLNEDCSVGVTTVHNVELDDPASPAGLYLEYRRVGNKFRIAIVETDSGCNDTSVRPWADCTREEKLKTFKHLPELLAKIVDNVNEQIKETQEAITRVTASLAALRDPVQTN